MSALMYGTLLRFRMDLRTRDMLVACYMVPLLFYVVMGFVFTSILPDAHQTIIASMIIMGVSLGGLIGVSSAVCGVAHGAVQHTLAVNGISSAASITAVLLSGQAHLTILALIILLTAKPLLGADFPTDPAAFIGTTEILIAATLAVAALIGILVQDVSKLGAVSQIVFLPSVLLSGIMFPADMLPEALQAAGNVLPATWGFRALMGDKDALLPLILICIAAAVFAAVLGRVLRGAARSPIRG